MPYITCPSCGTSVYSAAAWSTRDHCPRCLTRLAPRPHTLAPEQLRWPDADEPRAAGGNGTGPADGAAAA